MAALCGDLARITDTRALPALLERAAGILDATGIVLWIADPDGRELSPIVVHGYPPQLATRLGNLARDAGERHRVGLPHGTPADDEGGRDLERRRRGAARVGRQAASASWPPK